MMPKQQNRPKHWSFLRAMNHRTSRHATLVRKPGDADEYVLTCCPGQNIVVQAATAATGANAVSFRFETASTHYASVSVELFSGLSFLYLNVVRSEGDASVCVKNVPLLFDADQATQFRKLLALIMLAKDTLNLDDEMQFMIDDVIRPALLSSSIAAQKEGPR